MKKRALHVIFALLSVFPLNGCWRKISPQAASIPSNVTYAGVRSSNYGIKPFPAPLSWQSTIDAMRGYFPGSTPCAIWIVGEFKRPKTCHLFFPSEGKACPYLEFEETDKHEQFLSHFDTTDIKIFLQVEPAHADLPTLIDLVLGRYGRHPCIVGFGVDVEWYREADRPEWGVPVDDETAKQWEARVKSYNSSYRLFLKHWDPNWMPQTYRGDIIFVDDSQEMKDLEAMLDEFQNRWADHFHPSTVFFQVGYNSDKPWWKKLATPPQTIGRAIARKVKQECGIIWVDFSLRDVFPISAK